MHFLLRLGFILILLASMQACSSNDSVMNATMSAEAGAIQRGRELVRGLAACGSCHGETASPASLLSGGRTFSDKYGEVRAPNLTTDKSGLGTWRDYDIMTAIRAAVSPEGDWLSRELHAGFEWMSDSDAFAVVAMVKIVSGNFSYPSLRFSLQTRIVFQKSSFSATSCADKCSIEKKDFSIASKGISEKAAPAPAIFFKNDRFDVCITINSFFIW